MEQALDFDFEEAFRVIKIDENNYVGVHPLRLPIKLARGVYGGNTCAQTLLVAIESTPGFVPHAFHSYFIGAGNHKIPMTYKVTKLHDGRTYSSRSILVMQNDQVKYTCIVSLKRTGSGSKDNHLDLQTQVPELHTKYPNPDKLHIVRHTDYIRNAYSDEFVDHELVPKEANQSPSERWITVFSGIDKKELFKDPRYNYVGLACLSDSALLTTLARVLHMPWNPTEDHPFEEFEREKDALALLRKSFNILHLFHYNAMSLDHHIYFHCDDYENDFDVCKEWLTFSYQVKRLSNNRALVRGHLYNNKGVNVATVIQEGLTYLFNGIPDQAKL